MISKASKTNSAGMSKPAIRSFERLWYFTLGINGEKLEKNGYKNYCREKCKLVDCEYNLNKKY